MRSTNVIASNLSRDNILFSTFYTGLFFTFRKKTGGARAPPPAPPLATALKLGSIAFFVSCAFIVCVAEVAADDESTANEEDFRGGGRGDKPVVIEEINK